AVFMVGRLSIVRVGGPKPGRRRVRFVGLAMLLGVVAALFGPAGTHLRDVLPSTEGAATTANMIPGSETLGDYPWRELGAGVVAVEYDEDGLAAFDLEVGTAANATARLSVPVALEVGARYTISCEFMNAAPGQAHGLYLWIAGASGGGAVSVLIRDGRLME